MAIQPKCTLILGLLMGVVGSFRLPVTIQSEHTELATVTLTNIDSTNSRQKRESFSKPNKVKAEFVLSNQIVVLSLIRNDDISSNIPIYVERNGAVVQQHINSNNMDNVAFYQDLDNGASIVLQEHPGLQQNLSSPETLGCHMFGTFHAHGNKYHIEPVLDNQEVAEPTPPKHKLSKLKNPVDFGNDYKVLDESQMQPKLLKFDFHRTKRQAVTANKVELLMVTDFAVYNYWLDKSTASTAAGKDQEAKENIRQFYSFIANGMDARYKNMNIQDIEISVVVAGLFIADTAGAAYWTEARKILIGLRHQVEVGGALVDFENWIVGRSSSLPGHDHAMLFTALDLTGSGSAVVSGFAYYSAICTDQSQSVVEDHFNFIVETVATHELGHSLGAVHDGIGNACDGNDGYIMAAVSSAVEGVNTRHPWIFSSCAKNDIRTKLLSSTSDCLRTLSAGFDPNYFAAYQGQLPGEVFTADQQCQHMYGDDSYVCRPVYANNYDSFCTGVWCKLPFSNQCVMALPGEGTSCGNKKWCIDGVCVSSASAPSTPVGCPLGDLPGIVAEGKTCAETINPEPGLCYEEFISQTCCSSCANYGTGIGGCEYGNRVDTCLIISSRDCYNSNTEWACCLKCSTFVNTSNPDCRYGDRAANCEFDLCSIYSTSDLPLCCSTCAAKLRSTIPPTTGPPTTRAPTTPGPSTPKPTTHAPTTPRPTTPRPTTPRPSTPRPTTPGPTTPRPTTQKPTTPVIEPWIIALAAGGGAVLLVVLGVICYCCMRRSEPHGSSQSSRRHGSRHHNYENGYAPRHESRNKRQSPRRHSPRRKHNHHKHGNRSFDNLGFDRY